jgi:small subunit ribosomal protein S7
MGRKKKTVDRGILPDPKYNSVIVSKFVNRMMWEGKRSVSLRIVHDALETLRTKTGKEPLEVFLKALDNVKPMVEVKSRRVGGATYQVPIEIRETRREALGMRWLINAARSRAGIVTRSDPPAPPYSGGDSSSTSKPPSLSTRTIPSRGSKPEGRAPSSARKRPGKKRRNRLRPVRTRFLGFFKTFSSLNITFTRLPVNAIQKGLVPSKYTDKKFNRRERRGRRE